jgi:hypothetical protein
VLGVVSFNLVYARVSPPLVSLNLVRGSRLPAAGLAVAVPTGVVSRTGISAAGVPNARSAPSTSGHPGTLERDSADLGSCPSAGPENEVLPEQPVLWIDIRIAGAGKTRPEQNPCARVVRSQGPGVQGRETLAGHEVRNGRE